MSAVARLRRALPAFALIALLGLMLELGDFHPGCDVAPVTRSLSCMACHA